MTRPSSLTTARCSKIKRSSRWKRFATWAIPSPPGRRGPARGLAGGRITVWATTQNPFVVRTQLANIFKVPVSKVRIVVPYLGGGYGGKVYPKIEPITVALAQKAGRPVRVVLSREEVFYTITKHAAVLRLKTGVKKDGTLVARECEIHLDTGAYAEIGPRVAKKSGYTAAGPYKIPTLKIDSYS